MNVDSCTMVCLCIDIHDSYVGTVTSYGSTKLYRILLSMPITKLVNLYLFFYVISFVFDLFQCIFTVALKGFFYQQLYYVVW